MLKTKPIFKFFLLSVSLICAIYTIRYVSIYRITKNFHEVERGRLYRLAQLFHDELQSAVAQYGIKSVISLRGASKKSWWFQPEETLLKKMDVKFAAIGFNKDSLPSREEVLRLLDAFQNMPKPILIHCRTGADRTGEAAAICAMEQMGQTPDEALEQLSFKYFHVPFFAPAKRYFVKNYRGRSWVENDYDPCSSEMIVYYGRQKCVKNRTSIFYLARRFIFDSILESFSAI